MNEGRTIITSFALFIAVLGSCALLFAYSNTIFQTLLVIGLALGGALSLRFARRNPHGWLLLTLVFAAFVFNSLSFALSLHVDLLILLTGTVSLIGLLASVSGIGPTRAELYRQKMSDRARRDAVTDEVTLMPIRELKEGEVLPGTKVPELHDFKTNKAYDSEDPVVNPKFVNKKKAKTPSGDFVAARTGQYYYSVDDPAAQRIKASNRIYFKSTAEARKKGFKKR